MFIVKGKQTQSTLPRTEEATAQSWSILRNFAGNALTLFCSASQLDIFMLLYICKLLGDNFWPGFLNVSQPLSVISEKSLGSWFANAYYLSSYILSGSQYRCNEHSNEEDAWNNPRNWASTVTPLLSVVTRFTFVPWFWSSFSDPFLTGAFP